MAFSASSAALLALPFPSSSSDDSDEFKPLSTPPVPEPVAASPPPPQQRRQRLWLNLERDCNIEMKALAHAGDVDEVVDLFAELRRRFAAGAGVAPNVLCYNTLLSALADAGRVEEVGGVFEEMCEWGVAPNVSTLNILVKVHAFRAFNFEAAYDLIRQMQGLGVEPDVGTYSTLITGLCRAGRLDEAWGLLESMVEEGCLPMVHTYTPIVQGYCREGRIQEAMELMDEMERVDAISYLERSTALNLCAGVVAYNTVMSRLCDMGRWPVVLKLMTDMIKKDSSR
ncbi:hypothetical protein QOZ80_2BG0164870 [Eleusine coracana subsp. coracana]|nr:hypothetical protein QOZ80_2BG0164870 [Eleusine coracana subsp. coracana]